MTKPQCECTLRTRHNASTCQFSDSGAAQVDRNDAAVEARTAFRVRAETSHRLQAVDVVEVYQRTRVTRSGSYGVQRPGASGRLCAVRMTRQTDAAGIGVLGRRTFGHAVRSVLCMSTCVALVRSLPTHAHITLATTPTYTAATYTINLRTSETINILLEIKFHRIMTIITLGQAL